jgi:hypothetical protein
MGNTNSLEYTNSLESFIYTFIPYGQLLSRMFRDDNIGFSQPYEDNNYNNIGFLNDGNTDIKNNINNNHASLAFSIASCPNILFILLYATLLVFKNIPLHTIIITILFVYLLFSTIGMGIYRNNVKFDKNKSKINNNDNIYDVYMFYPIIINFIFFFVMYFVKETRGFNVFNISSPTPGTIDIELIKFIIFKLLFIYIIGIVPLIPIYSKKCPNNNEPKINKEFNFEYLTTIYLLSEILIFSSLYLLLTYHQGNTFDFLQYLIIYFLLISCNFIFVYGIGNMYHNKYKDKFCNFEPSILYTLLLISVFIILVVILLYAYILSQSRIQ